MNLRLSDMGSLETSLILMSLGPSAFPLVVVGYESFSSKIKVVCLLYVFGRETGQIRLVFVLLVGSSDQCRALSEVLFAKRLAGPLSIFFRGRRPSVSFATSSRHFPPQYFSSNSGVFLYLCSQAQYVIYYTVL